MSLDSVHPPSPVHPPSSGRTALTGVPATLDAGDAGSDAALADLATVLVAGETVVAVALQHRLHALWRRRTVCAATSGRFLMLRRRLLGGYDLAGVRWQDVRRADLTVGVFWATLSLAYSANLSDTAMGEDDTRVIVAAGLRRHEAQALYRECEAQEQSWREKRRVRSIEEMRARAGGVQIATGVYPPPQPPGESALNPTGDGPTERLSRAKAMLDAGLITDTEYWAIKARIVDAL